MGLFYLNLFHDLNFVWLVVEVLVLLVPGGRGRGEREGRGEGGRDEGFGMLLPVGGAKRNDDDVKRW